MKTKQKGSSGSPTVPCCASLLELRDACGIPKANCHSCAFGSADSDGEMGNTYYCGMVCSIHETDETYLEDAGIDVDAEKGCWEPNFWQANAPALEISHPIDGTDESVQAALAAFTAFCQLFLHNSQDQSPDKVD